MKYILRFFVYSLLISIRGQSIPQEYLGFKQQLYSLDRGLKWNENSNIDMLSYNFDKKNDEHKINNLKLNFKLGSNVKNNGFSIYASTYLQYKDNFYSYFYGRLVNDSYNYDRFSGLPQNKSRFGFNAGEIDLSGFGYKNQDFILQFGRGRQNIAART